MTPHGRSVQTAFIAFAHLNNFMCFQSLSNAKTADFFDLKGVGSVNLYLQVSLSLLSRPSPKVREVASTVYPKHSGTHFNAIVVSRRRWAASYPGSFVPPGRNTIRRVNPHLKMRAIFIGSAGAVPHKIKRSLRWRLGDRKMVFFS